MSHLGFADNWGKASARVDALFTRKENTSTVSHELGNGFSVHRVRDGSALFTSVVNLLTAAECGTTTTAPDPLLDWVYAARDDGTGAITNTAAGNGDFDPQPGGGKVFEPLANNPSSRRQAWFGWLMEYLTFFATNRNGCYALLAENKSSGHPEVVAAALTCPPRNTPFNKSYDEMGRNIRRAGMAMGQEILTNNRRMRTLGVWQGTTADSLTATLGGSNHLKIEVFATHPDWQGTGCGSALLGFLGAVADADGAAAYLETAGGRNVGFYHKKGGFEEVAKSPVANFAFQGGGVAMLRPARREQNLGAIPGSLSVKKAPSLK